MTTHEKVQISSDTTKLTLFKEGMFYKCYNEDAMVFTQHVKAYKLLRKFVKTIGAELVSIGFPIANETAEANAMNDIAQQLGAISYEITNTMVGFILATNFKIDYQKWLLQLDTTTPINKDAFLSEPGDLRTTDLIHRIQEFDLANSTPMQCINFIHLLKQEVKNRGAEYGNV